MKDLGMLGVLPSLADSSRFTSTLWLFSSPSGVNHTHPTIS
ncbi:hypothetical protein IC006_1433 [Sulfuracidifex tepidarius]|uniref:Uncharacterized protein n=1 Tax=Sulfuracidifex tepidarius TaxID=1294262 RepID=A0A510DV96_9CREN|nr:hypothetical protein IC006_1433 [Sulfuracidifex tepidarius]BBG26887.1 hypothetical protein IC007_1409 [Sulfuracidifex tepidarius]